MKVITLITPKSLGDNIIASRQPQMLHEAGYKVYIARHTKFKPEIYDFLWGKNPYVSGRRSIQEDDIICGAFGKWTIPHFPPHVGEYAKEVDLALDEYIYTLPFPEDVETNNNRRNTIFYKPQIIPELADVTIVDTNISSYRISEPDNPAVVYYNKKDMDSINDFVSTLSNVRWVRAHTGSFLLAQPVRPIDSIYCFVPEESVLANGENYLGKRLHDIACWNLQKHIGDNTTHELAKAIHV